MELETRTHEGPVPGAGITPPGNIQVTPDKRGKIILQYKVFNITFDTDQIAAQEIMTTSGNCEGRLEKVGDIRIQWDREKTNFTKEGNFQVALLYHEVVALTSAEIAELTTKETI